MRLFSFFLPGMSAGSRLGISERERDSSAPAQVKPKPAKDAAEEEHLPRDDAFYWSMMHSHL